MAIYNDSGFSLINFDIWRNSIILFPRDSLTAMIFSSDNGRSSWKDLMTSFVFVSISFASARIKVPAFCILPDIYMSTSSFLESEPAILGDIDENSAKPFVFISWSIVSFCLTLSSRNMKVPRSGSFVSLPQNNSRLYHWSYSEIASPLLQSFHQMMQVFLKCRV